MANDTLTQPRIDVNHTHTHTGAETITILKKMLMNDLWTEIALGYREQTIDGLKMGQNGGNQQPLKILYNN